jgi:hypothetical protein
MVVKLWKKFSDNNHAIEQPLVELYEVGIKDV